MINQINLAHIVEAAYLAGEKILEVYGLEDFQIENKEDDSPLTIADKYSNDIITEKLNEQYSNIPILSEEGKHLSHEERKDWEYLWVVDPLDGTKEFIKRNGEFTVNIALVQNDTPVLGVIYAPVLDTVYFSKQGVGAFKLEGLSNSSFKNEQDLIEKSIEIPDVSTKDKKYVVASRSHMSRETEDYVEQIKSKYGEVEITSAGSSLKLCLVAEGKADVYPRFAPTMEWDTAAGQAIIEHAGGTVVQVGSDERVRYNKENLLNPWFIAKKRDFKG